MPYDNHELMATVELAAKLYSTELLTGTSNQSDRARAYVTQRRLFRPMLELFRIGYAPATVGPQPWLLTKIKDRKLLLEAGLLIETPDGNLRDPMAGRLVFPQTNPVGKYLGFVGRDIRGTSQDKYLSTAATPIWRRQEVLYRIDRARLSIEGSRTAIVVEGLLDAALLYQVGVRNVVATGTKAMTDAQAQLLARYARHVEVMFDNEEQARKAFEELRKKRGQMFETVTWREYPAKFNDPADWVAAQIDRRITEQQAAVVG